MMIASLYYISLELYHLLLMVVFAQFYIALVKPLVLYFITCSDYIFALLDFRRAYQWLQVLLCRVYCIRARHHSYEVMSGQ